MNLRNVAVATLCATSLSLNGVASAQQAQNQAGQAQPAAGQARPGQAGQQTRWQTTDQGLASCIAIANQTEVAISKFAEEKAKNKDVKEFAKMMVKDHQEFLRKLERFAPEAAREGYLNERTETAAANPARVQPAGGEVKNANSQIQQTAGTRSDANQPLDMIQLHREVAEECIRSAKLGMNKKDGVEFDECYIGFQIAAHAEMKNKLTVFKRHVSGDLAQVISEGLETTEKHLKKAENLIKDLADSDQSDNKRTRESDKK